MAGELIKRGRVKRRTMRLTRGNKEDGWDEEETRR